MVYFCCVMGQGGAYGNQLQKQAQCQYCCMVLDHGYTWKHLLTHNELNTRTWRDGKSKVDEWIMEEEDEAEGKEDL